MMIIRLQPKHGLPVAVAICSCFVTAWASAGVMRARKKYAIEYPTMYADKSNPNADAFNCYQRAHQNVLENFPQFIILLALGAVHRPIAAAVAGAVRLGGVIVYVINYQTGDPAKRVKGNFGYAGLVSLLVMSTELSIRMLASPP